MQHIWILNDKGTELILVDRFTVGSNQHPQFPYSIIAWQGKTPFALKALTTLKEGTDILAQINSYMMINPQAKALPLDILEVEPE